MGHYIDCLKAKFFESFCQKSNSLNPDGYQYSHDLDRMWRKNRADNNHLCRGVDINLNFPIGFGEKGDSQTTNPCNFEYPSTQPLDQPEAEVERYFFLIIKITVFVLIFNV